MRSMSMTTEIFSSLKELSPVGFGVRTVFVGILLWFVSRWLPRRSGGQFAGYDFTFYWMMGGLMASPLYDSRISFVNTLTAVVTVFFWHYALSYLSVKNRTWARILSGKPVTLIEGGKVLRENLRRSLVPLEMLMSELRTFDAANPAEVETAILETSGHVSVLKKAEQLPVTPGDLEIMTQEAALPVLLVDDGKIREHELHGRGYARAWLQGELNKHGAGGVEEVYMATVDSGGQVTVSLKNPAGR